MHPQVNEFIARVKERFPHHFNDVNVLEIGSYNINGSVRSWFKARNYIGVDLIEGPSVDIVIGGHEVNLTELFDVVISTECFEHNPEWEATFVNMAKHTRPGGLVIMTCASAGRNPHGLSHANPDDSPGTISRGWEYYANLEEHHFANFPLRSMFTDTCFEYSAVNKDLYFWGVRR